MGAIVLSGCHIGSGSIIAAGAVVKKTLSSHLTLLVVGIPARIVRTDETPNRTYSQSSF